MMTAQHQERLQYISEEMRRLGVAIGNSHPTVTLCGSSRFYDAFQLANYELTMAGCIVLSIGFYPHAVAEMGGHGEGVGHDSAEKKQLDELHFEKIRRSDAVVFLNVGGYIGDSTFNELRVAKEAGKPRFFLESLPKPKHQIINEWMAWGREDVTPPQDKLPLVNKETLFALCSALMNTDPELFSQDNERVVTEFLDMCAKEHGYTGWMEAHHDAGGAKGRMVAPPVKTPRGPWTGEHAAGPR